MSHVVSRTLLLAVVLAGCAESHSRATTDPDPCVAGAVGSAPFSCVSSYGGICSDFLPPAECVEGVWQCPGATVPQGDADCWCYGAAPTGCTCTPRGWSCGGLDAGIPDVLDAGPECPSDPASVDGDPCAPEGLWCGECTDSCASCSLLACIGGRWQRPTAGPPGEPCTRFDCGPELRCAAEREYCQHTLSDTDLPDDFACEPLPSDCSGCECFPGGGCIEGAEGGVTVTYGGA